MVLNASLFGALVIGAEALPSQPVTGILLVAVAATALVALLRRELPKAAPLIPLDLLCRRPFLISVIASVCCFAGQAAGMVALPFHLQHEFGQTPWMTGLLMTPWPLMVAVTSQIAGRLSACVPTAWLCAVGGIGLTVGLGLFRAVAAWRRSLLTGNTNRTLRHRLRPVSGAQQPQHVSCRSH